jgi:hypothetical protein
LHFEKGADEMKRLVLWADIYPGMSDQHQIYWHNSAPTTPPSPPNKRVWAEIWMPDDKELFPELFGGVELTQTTATTKESEQ